MTKNTLASEIKLDSQQWGATELTGELQSASPVTFICR